MRTLEAIACGNAQKTTECLIIQTADIKDVLEIQTLLNRLDSAPNLEGWNSGIGSLKERISQALFDYHFSVNPTERKIKRDLIVVYFNSLFIKNK